MNWLDRRIATLSPQWALRRAVARSRLEAVQRVSLAYDAAKAGRRHGQGWSTPGTGPNTEISGAIVTMRNRVRDLVRNNPYASVVPSKMSAKVWGTGIVPRLRTGDIEDPRRVRDRDIWNGFCDASDPTGQCDFYGQIASGARALFESGEFLIRFHPRKSSFRTSQGRLLTVPLQIEILEPDYIATLKNELLSGGGMINAGIEYAADGTRAAYHLYKDHPGEITTFSRGGFDTERVPAADICHVFQSLRPGQARGVPLLAPVVIALRDIGEYRDAELMAKKLQACFAVFVTRPGVAVNPLTESANVSTNAANQRIEQMEPGIIEYLRAGEDVEFATPPASQGYVEYMKDQLRAVAAGCGMPYEMLTGDLSGTNYSSIRAGMIDFWELVDLWQWHVFVHQVCKPVWARVGAAAGLAGLRGLSEPWTALWTPPGRRFIDPMKDAEAERELVRTGQKSLPASIAASGEDPDEVVLEASRFNAVLDRYGIVWDSDPRKVGKASAPQPAAPAKSE